MNSKWRKRLKEFPIARALNKPEKLGEWHKQREIKDNAGGEGNSREQDPK